MPTMITETATYVTTIGNIDYKISINHDTYSFTRNDNSLYAGLTIKLPNDVEKYVGLIDLINDVSVIEKIRTKMSICKEIVSNTSVDMINTTVWITESLGLRYIRENENDKFYIVSNGLGYMSSTIHELTEELLTWIEQCINNYKQHILPQFDRFVQTDNEIPVEPEENITETITNDNKLTPWLIISVGLNISLIAMVLFLIYGIL